MTYHVIITPAADNDLRTAYRYIRSRRLVRRATGSGVRARAQKVLRATPSIVS